MRAATLDEEGKVIDRKNKSLGSGGEQAVPNYLLILTIAHFMYRGKKMRLHTLLFDEAFYGIDAGRRDRILGFATDLGLQLFIASPDQARLRQFFGVTPLRINNKEETLLDFDRLIGEATQEQWLNRIGRQLGRPLSVAQSREIEQEAKIIISRLNLAFPQLSMITAMLSDRQSDTHALFLSLLKEKDAQAMTDLAFQTAQAVVFL